MPYRLSRNKLCVQKKEKGRWKNLKCHDTTAEALAHLRALEVNVTEKLTIESVRQWVQEAGGSMDDHVYRVRREFHQWFNDGLEWKRMAWPLDVFEDHLMVKYGEQTFRVDYVVHDDYIEFADTPWPVYVLRYVPATEAEGETPAEETTTEAVREVVNLTVQLSEATKDKKEDGWWRDAVIVVEGRSANGNRYTEAALESGVTIFEGARLVADHELEEGESARPEGSVREAVGKVTNTHVGESKGKKALRGDVFISAAEPGLRTKVDEGILGDLSIRAWGAGMQSDDGDFVVEAFQSHPYTNIAMVTVGAAGGALVSESQRVENDPEPATENQPEPDADDTQPVTEVRHLRESDTDQPENIELSEVLNENARLLQENTQLFREAREMHAETQIAEAISGTGDLPPVTLKRIAEQVAGLKEAFATHGSQQTVEQFREAVEAVVEAERAYLAQITPNGAVTGLTQPGGDQPVEDILTEAFEDIVPPGTVKVAVRGRG